MTLLLLVALADLKAPLGPYARTGVPVLLRSDAPTVVDLDGWIFRIDGTTPVFPPALPCVVRDEEGRELLRLEDAGERSLTAVVDGDVPEGLADAFRVSAVALAAGHWRALDLFDRVLVPGPVRGDEAWFPCVARWVHAGGSLAGPDAARLFATEGLGAVAPRLEDLPPPRIPVAGNVRPDVYGLVKRIASRSAPLRAARWIVLGAAAASALLLALSRRVRAGPLLLALAAVSAAGLSTGLLRTRADYTPTARGRIVVSYFGGGVERRRTYLVYGHAGPGAVAPRAPDAAPILFGRNRAPWWRGAGGEVVVERDVVRVFLAEEILDAPPPPPLPEPGAPDDLWANERPRRGGASATASPVASPEAAPRAPVLLEVRVVAQD